MLGNFIHNKINQISESINEDKKQNGNRKCVCCDKTNDLFCCIHCGKIYCIDHLHSDDKLISNHILFYSIKEDKLFCIQCKSFFHFMIM